MAKIAIDIDDTITNSSKVIRKYAMLYQDKYTNDKILTKKLDEVLRGIFNDDAIKEFFKEYACEMANKCKIKFNAKKVINKLHKQGHQIYIVTARSDNYYIDSYNFCKNYLDKKKIKYDKLITSQLYKVKVCQEESIDIMIDDAVDTCDSLNNVGIKAFLYNSKLNKNKKTISTRVNSWNEVYKQIQIYLKSNI